MKRARACGFARGCERANTPRATNSSIPRRAGRPRARRGKSRSGSHTRVSRVPQLENHPSRARRLQNAPLAERAAWIVAVLRGPARDVRTISAPGHRRDVRLHPRRRAGRRRRRWKRCVTGKMGAKSCTPSPDRPPRAPPRARRGTRAPPLVRRVVPHGSRDTTRRVLIDRSPPDRAPRLAARARASLEICSAPELTPPAAPPPPSLSSRRANAGGCAPGVQPADRERRGRSHDPAPGDPPGSLLLPAARGA